MRDILFVDDMEHRFRLAEIAFPNDRIVWAETVELAAMLAMQEWDLVCLDHDAGMPGTEDVVNFFPVVCVVAMNPNVKDVIVHTANRPAGDRMVSLLEDYGKNVKRHHFELKVPV